jgi:hypothetical protein
MMEAARTFETLVKRLPDYTALQPRRQPTIDVLIETAKHVFEQTPCGTNCCSVVGNFVKDRDLCHLSNPANVVVDVDCVLQITFKISSIIVILSKWSSNTCEIVGLSTYNSNWVSTQCNLWISHEPVRRELSEVHNLALSMCAEAAGFVRWTVLILLSSLWSKIRIKSRSVWVISMKLDLAAREM